VIQAPECCLLQIEQGYFFAIKHKAKNNDKLKNVMLHEA